MRFTSCLCGIIIAGLSLGLLALARQTSWAADAGLLRMVGAIDLPGPAGKRFDYLEVDIDDGYLLSAHLGAGMLYVIDLDTGRLAKAIPDLPGIEGVAHIPGLHKAYASDWHEDRIAVIDLASMTVVKKLPTEKKPDGITYAEPFRKAYVVNERGGRGWAAQLPGRHGGAVTVVDVDTDEVRTTLHFDSETGVPQYDPVARRVYVNLEDKDELAVIDPATDRVEQRWPVPGCRGNHGMAIDALHRRAFLSCEDNDTLAVVDLKDGTVVTKLPMADGADVVAFDPGLGRVYVACSSGFISVFQEDDPAHFRKLADVSVQKKVHSLAVDPRTHRLYVPEEQEDGKPVSRIVIYEAVSVGSE